MSSTQTSFLDNLVSAVRENPLAATLIGAGAVWLLTGSEKLKSAANSASAAVSPLVDIGAQNVRTTASGFQRTTAPPLAPEIQSNGSFNAGEKLREAVDATTDAISGTANEIKNGIEQSRAYAQEKIGNLGNPVPGKETFQKVQSSLADVLEGQPLVVGVIGLTIGAAVASAFRLSDMENEWLGKASDDLRADLSARAEAVSQSLRESGYVLKAELGDTGAEAVDRLKQASVDAVNAAQENARSS
jgi:hypothetical protein